MKKRLPKYFNLMIIVLMDTILIGGSWYGSFLLRFNFELPQGSFEIILKLMPVIVLIKVIIFYFFHAYRGMWRYTSIIDLFNIIKACVFSSVIIIALLMFTHGFIGLARSVFIIDGMLTILFVSGLRICMRLYFEIISGERNSGNLLDRLVGRKINDKDAIKLLIIGAGDSGEKI